MTKNEQTVTEIYVVDENLHVEGLQTVVSPSPAARKTLEIGSLCNNAVLSQTEGSDYIGQSTDVALLNILPTFGLHDQRYVCQFVPNCALTKVLAGFHPILRRILQLGAKVHGRQWYTR